MGLFSKFVNYETPGPGVDKREPKKKGAALFFSVLKNKFWKLIPLSLLTILVSLPIVTIGLGDVGAAYVTRNFACQKSTFVKDDFFGAIKQNWKQALPVGLINLLVTGILIFGIYFYFLGWNASFLYKAGLVISGCVFIVFTFMKYYINMLIVTFRLKGKQLYKNSLLLSSAGLKENLVITAALLVLYGLLFVLPMLTLMYFGDMVMTTVCLMLTVLFLPALRSLIIQFCVFPVVKKHMIDPYYEQHPDEKKELYLLNLEDEDEEETEDEDAVLFKDNGKEETPERTFPKQYSDRELHRSASKRRASEEDDDTF